MEEWKFIAKKGIWELWKTPTMFLVCYHYGRQFYFYSNEQDAKEFLSLQSFSNDLEIVKK